MVRMIQKIALLSVVFLAVGCSAIEGLGDPGEWELVEPAEDAEQEPVEPSDCTTLDEKQWEPEDFTFVYFRYLECISGEQENIVFSPVAIRLALGEQAGELDNQQAQRIADLLGYQQVDQMYEEGEQLREELLARRPMASEKIHNSGWKEYEIEDQPLDRLQEAIGLEFYAIECSNDEEAQCEWQAHTDRWEDDTMLESEAPTGGGATDTTPTDALVLRAQVEHYLGTSYHPAMAFQVSDELVVQRYEMPHLAESYIELDGFVLIRWRLVGGQWSIFFIRPMDMDLEQVTTRLSSAKTRGWIDSMEWSNPGRRPITRAPLFDIEQTWEVSEALGLQTSLRTTTRVHLDEYGINSPNPVELLHETQVAHSTSTDRQHFRVDSPFLFFIYDEPADAILKFGRVSYP